MALAGKGGALYVGTTPTKVAEITTWSLDVSADAIDVTSFDSDGWQENLPGLKSWSGSAEGNWKVNTDTQGQKALQDAWLNGTLIQVQFRINDTNYYAGQALVTGLSIEAPVDDKISFSVDLTGSGPLTPTLA
jgi:Predicted secreted protein